MTEVVEKTELKQRGRPFRPGHSGNPAGRPKGARHAALLALDLIGAEGAQDVMNAVVAAAKAGDMRAADILLRRLWPERKGRPVALALPVLSCAGDAVNALTAVVAATASGEVSPEEACALTTVVDAWRRTLETDAIERRIAALEASSRASK